MATITFTSKVTGRTYTRSFTLANHQGWKRRDWRKFFSQSAECDEWDAEREDYATYAPGMVRRPLHGIRASYRRLKEQNERTQRREAVFAQARQTVGNTRMYRDEHDPEL